MKSKVKILFILMFIGILYFSLGLGTVEAKQLSTPLYFGINEMRTLSQPNMGYAIGDPNSNGAEGNAAKLWNILKYSTNTSNDPTEVDVYCVKAGVGFSNTYRRATYDFAFDMYKEREGIASFSSILSGLVNGGHYNELLALANILYLAEDETEDLEAFLNKAQISEDYWDSLLTVDEVKAVQQAAIWYFTNYGEENGKYDKTDDSNWLNYTLDGNTYTSLSDYQIRPDQIGYQRQKQAEQLYKYLINTAKANSNNYSNPNKNYKTKLTLYTAKGTNGEEQPLVEIEREKQFDLSLRKYITKVNGTNVSVSRVPKIDVENLKNESNTTATYNHKKDPVLVQNGDVVTYNIQVYNEGDVDGYVNKIVDQLPTGLKFSRLITGGYTANYDSSNNVVTITRDESNKDRLVAFDGSNLDSTTLELECIVDTTEGDKVLTNVAWIAEEETIDGNIITNEVGDDRDSEPDTKPNVNKDNMEDYKGNNSNKDDLTDTNYFYEGQQDDDDFEKLITKKLEGSYDLQIVKVDKDNEQTRLQGAEFRITMPGGSILTKTTDENGVIDLDEVDITETGIDTIKIEEITPPEGYNKLFNSFELDITKEEQNGAYVATNVDLKNTQGSGVGTGEVQVDNQSGMITITVPNEKLDGSYDLQIVKVDKDNEQTRLQGAEFKITMPGGSIVTKTTDENGVIDLDEVDITERGIDTIKIEEITPPEGYNKLFNSFELDITKEEQNGAYAATNVDLKNTQGSGVGTGEVQVDNQNGMITITVPNEKLDGSYDLQIVKVDKDNEQTRLQGAEFRITMPGGSILTKTTDENGVIDLDEVDITETGIDTIKIEEITPPEGYNKLFNSFELDITKEEQNGAYAATNVDLKNTQGSGVGTGEVQVDNQNGMIIITVPNEKLDGSYDLQIVKVDKDNEQTRLQGAEFKITMPDGSIATKTTDENGVIDLDEVDITETGIDTIKIEEITPPEGYNKLFNSFELDITKEEQNGAYVATNVDLKNTRGSGVGTGEVQVDNQSGMITITVPNEKLDGSYDLQIVKVDKDNAQTRLQGAEFRITMPDGSIVTKTTDENGVIDLDEVDITETGIDTIKVEEITPPEGYNKLFNSFELDITKEEQNGAYAATNVDLKNTQGSGVGTGEVQVDNQNGMITITVPNEKLDGSYSVQIEKVDSQDNSIKLQGAEFKITLPNSEIENKTTNEQGVINTSIIEISEVNTNDRITIEEITAPEGYNKIIDSITIEIEKKMENGVYKLKNANIIDGQLDGASVSIDGNTIKIIVKNERIKEFDLSLRKFIIAVSNDEIIEEGEYLKNEDGSYVREPVLDTSLLNTIGPDGKKITTAIYNHEKEPVEVERNDYVIYMLRVYNEGEIDGYASEIKDHLPPYLEFVDNEFNQGYGWEVSEDGRTVTTRYLENSLINAASKEENGYKLSYVEVPIMCRVKEEAITGENITNIADITEYQDKDKKPAEDRDSDEDNVELPEDENLPEYKDEEEGDYIPGQEDDDDFEKVVVEEKHFDLALRKFITKIDGKNIITRIPEVSYNETEQKIIYNHTKEPVLVVTDNIVIYTIRIYNEGDINGYANVISDDIPEGLEFLPDNETNINYRWVMYDKNGNITENVDDAVSIKTDYLSKEQEKNPGDNLLLAFNEDEPISETNPSYKEIQVAFRVIESNESDRIIINSAQISDDSDEDGNEAEDIDSTPDEWNEGEDDQDKEYIKLVYFDLSLRKWVTQAIVIDKDGNQTVTKTGHQPYDDPEQIVKVDLYRKSIYDLTVKFRYKIRVTNEGEIAGYAKEITDYVPEGLRFLPEDNPGWTDEGNNVISTRLLENTLLQPGEYAEVEVVLTWINGEDNMGEKINTAEISEDYNDYEAPDKDSTPDNQKEGEDDIDDAEVLLSVSTGQVRIYFTLGFVVLITIASGIILIKRFVL